MVLKKKVPKGQVVNKKIGRGVELLHTRRRPEQSAAYDAVLKEYEAGLALLRRKDFAEAKNRFQAAEQAATEEPELAERARTYAVLCEGRLAAPPAVPQDAEGRYHLGVVRANLGQIEEAIALFDAALRQEPGSARILFARASARALQGNASAAVGDLRQAIAADPKLRYQASNDGDFEKIRDEAAFIDLIEPTPAGA